MLLYGCTGTKASTSRLTDESPTRVERDFAYLSYMRARLHLEHGSHEMAIQELRAAMGQDPKDPFLRVEIARLYAQQGQLIMAVEQCEAAMAQDPSYPGSYLLMGQLQRDSRNYPAAVEAFGAAIRLDPEAIRAYLELAALHEDQGRSSQASAIYEKLLVLDSANAEASFRMAELALARADFEAAERFYLQCIEHDPGNLAAYDQLVSLFSSQGRVSEAIGMATRAFRVRPSDDLAQVLAELHLALGETTRATTYLNTIRDAHLGDPEILFRIAKTYLDAGSYTKSIRIFKEILRFDPEHHQARVYLGNARYGAQDPTGAMREFQRVHVLNPYYPFARLQIGRILQEQGKLDDAREIYEELLRASPGDQNLYRLLAENYERRGDWATAVRVLQDAVRRMPDDVHRIYMLGNTYHAAGQLHHAMRQIERALMVDPENVNALHLMGCMLVEQGTRLQEAETMIRKALALRPDSGEIVGSLGWVHLRMSRLDQALVELREAHRLRPDDPNLLDRLGDVYRAMGRADAARKAYRQGLSLGPDEELGMQMLEKLHSLGENEG